MYKRITITIPAEVLTQLDLSASIDSLSRSGYIREAIALKQELDAAVEAETNDRNSYVNVVQHMHWRRINQRRRREMGPLSWTEAQD